MNFDKKLDSSFRDPSGFLFYKNNLLYRQINKSYKEEYEYFMNSGLYEKLVSLNLIVSHREIEMDSFNLNDDAYKIIEPEKIKFISYPYEWCFSQLKNAALLTLEIQKISFQFGMTLKDATSYNIQFDNGFPKFIDTLSFEKYNEGQMWKPYKQFCQHFLAPLALMSHSDIRFNQLLKIYIDGIPLDLASKILGKSTRFNFSLLSHIHLHAKNQKQYEDKEISIKQKKLGKNSFVGIIESLNSGIKKLDWTPKGTEWGNYYSIHNYSDKSFVMKQDFIDEVIEQEKPKQVLDLGSNTGLFSRICSKKGFFTISLDIDPAAVEKNYLQIYSEYEKNILPLLLDITNPSPGLGWINFERDSFIQRCKSDLVLSLALIHHLAISNNIPLNKIAEFFSNICKNLVIEFIPKTDSQIVKLLRNRCDIFDEYNENNFEMEFKKFFTIIKKLQIADSQRVLYFMKKLD